MSRIKTAAAVFEKVAVEMSRPSDYAVRFFSRDIPTSILTLGGLLPYTVGDIVHGRGIERGLKRVAKDRGLPRSAAKNVDIVKHLSNEELDQILSSRAAKVVRKGGLLAKYPRAATNAAGMLGMFPYMAATGGPAGAAVAAGTGILGTGIGALIDEYSHGRISDIVNAAVKEKNLRRLKGAGKAGAAALGVAALVRALSGDKQESKE